MSDQRQRVRFTGKRTGREDMPVKGIGIVTVGDVVEVSLDEAERWTTELPMADGKEAADFVKVGGPVSVDESKASARDEAQREKMAENNAEFAPDVPMAHESGLQGKDVTAEEFAEAVIELNAAHVEDDKDSKGKGGKAKE